MYKIRSFSLFALFLYHINVHSQTTAPTPGAAAVPSIIPPQEPFLRLEIGEHTDAVRRIAATADGSLVATNSDDKTVRLWHMPDGKPAGILRVPIASGAEGKLYALAMSQDGSVLAASGATGVAWDAAVSLYIFDVKAARLRGRLAKQPNIINGLAYSPDGRYLAAVLGGKVGLRVWETANYKLAFTDTQYGGFGTWVTFAADGRLATAAVDGQIRIYAADFKLLQRRAAPGGSMPYSLAFSPDGELLAVGQLKKPAVDILSSHTLKPLYKANMQGITTGSLSAVAWTGGSTSSLSADLVLWAGGTAYQKDGQRLVRRWSNAGRGAWQDTAISRTNINALTEIPQVGLGVVFSDPGWGILNINNGQILLRHTAPIADFRSLYAGRFATSPDGTQIEFGVDFGGKRPFRFDTQRRTLQANPPEDSNLKSPLLTANKHQVSNWQDQTKPKLDKRSLKLAPSDISHSAALSQDGQTLVIGGEHNLYLFKKKAQPVVERSTTAPVWAVTVTQDGRTAIAALGDGTLQWYSLLPGRELELMVSLLMLPDKEIWIAWTPEGFFAHSENGGQDLVGFHLNALKPASNPIFANFSQVYPALHRPDLVSAKLTGEPSEQLASAVTAATSFIDNLRNRPLPTAAWISFCPAPVDTPLTGRAFKRSSPPTVAITGAAPAVTTTPTTATTATPVTNPVSLNDQCQTITGATRGFARIKAAPTAAEPISPVTTTATLPNQTAPTATTNTLVTALSKIIVQFEIQDEGGGISDIDLFQNGRLIGRMSSSDAKPLTDNETLKNKPDTVANAEQVAKPSPLLFERVIALQPGENNLKLRAFNSNYASTLSPLLTLFNEQPQNVPINKQLKRLFIVAVGINKYPYQPLTYAVADAKDTAHALQAAGHGLFDEIRLIERYDGAANSDSLKALFKELQETVDNGDTVVFYIAAHGALDAANQYYLITPDAVTQDGNLLDARTLTQSILTQAMGQIQSAGANILLMLDTCHAGALHQASVERIAGQIQNNTGMMVLAGSAGYQEAYDNFKNSGHGLLAYTALRGLHGDLKRSPNNDAIPAETFARWISNRATMDAYDIGLDKVIDFYKSNEINFQDFPLVQLQPVINTETLPRMKQ